MGNKGPEVAEAEPLRKNYHLRVHLLPRLAGLRLDQIDRERVQELVSEMAARVRRHTILNVLGTLRTILRTARSWGYLARDFAASELTIPSERAKSAARFFTAEQARRIIEEAEQPWKCLFAVAAMNGLRPGEVLGLTLDEADPERGLLCVRRTACFGKLVAPKTRSSVATVPIPDPLRVMLADYLAKWKPNAVRLLFATRSGRPHTTNKVNEYRLHPLLRKLGIPSCGLNGFRRTHASLLFLSVHRLS
jgi:integrase